MPTMTALSTYEENCQKCGKSYTTASDRLIICPKVLVGNLRYLCPKHATGLKNLIKKYCHA